MNIVPLMTALERVEAGRAWLTRHAMEREDCPERGTGERAKSWFLRIAEPAVWVAGKNVVSALSHSQSQDAKGARRSPGGAGAKNE